MKKNYILKLNSISYYFTIELFKNNIINFELRQADKISYDYYSTQYDYEHILELWKLEKNICDNKEKMIELFDDLIEKEKVYIIKDDNQNKIDLYINLEQNSKEKKYCINIEKKITTEKK